MPITYRVDHLDYSNSEGGDVVLDLVTTDRAAAVDRARRISRELDSGAAYVIAERDGIDIGDRAYYDGRLGAENGEAF